MSILNTTVQGKDIKASAPSTGASIGRILWGMFFIVSSIINLVITLPHPVLYRSFAELTFFPFYSRLLLSVAFPNAYLITGLVVIFELVVGVLILCKKAAVQWGLIFSAFWLLFVFPSMGWYTIFSPIFIIIPWSIGRYRYDRSALDLILRRGKNE